MDSMYFDDSLYENKMHFHISQILDSLNDLTDDQEEVVINCDNEEQYNKVLDSLYHYAKDKFKFFGVSSDPMKIIVEKDAREKYRVFNEDTFLMKKEDKVE